MRAWVHHLVLAFFRTRTQHRGNRTRTRLDPTLRDALGSLDQSTSNLEEAIFVLEALLAVALRNVQGNGLSGAKPLIAGRSVHASKCLGNAVSECDIIDFRVRVPFH